MKTTLKRGMGRGAAVNGNGRAVYPPQILPPMRRYRQPVPGRHRVWRVLGKILLWAVVATLMVAGGLAGGAYLYVEEDIVEALQARSFDVKQAQQRLDAVVPGEPTTALVIGYDKRAGAEGAETGNSDTLMLVRADPDRDTVSLLSFPRDLLVNIYGCRSGPFLGRISQAYTQCGSTASLQTMRNLTGLPINYLVTVNFRGFKQVVSNLGGVWIDVDRRYFNDNSQCCERYATIDLKPGYQKLNGQKALDFVRYRHQDSDIYRLARQQMFVKAVRQRVRDFSALKLPRLVSVVTENVEVGKADGTEFDADTILNYALFLYQLPAGHVFQAKLDPNRLTDDAAFNVITDDATVRQAVEDFVRPDVEAATKATDSALKRKPKAPAGPAPSEVTVTVLNGNGVPGAAGNASNQLAAKGYQMVVPPNGKLANAPSWKYFETEVYYDGGTGGYEQAAAQVAKLFGSAKVKPLPGDIAPLTNGSMLTVVVGQTYHGTLASAPADRTPKRKPPFVRRDSSAVSVLRDVRRRVPFPLYAPTVIERSSRLAHQSPVRVYQLGDHNTVRLTFTDGITDFWGIQMTDWKDAPVLDGPNEVTKIGKRTYRLYYNGAHLHMVVLEADGATYWVVNSLLDTLSNETMLEIAKGLRPLGRR
jgi:LCP family protein required for cell wall assembly